MKKKILLFILVFSMIFINSVFAVNISIDDTQVKFTNQSGAPFIDNNNRTQVPLRVTMESFGAKVDWIQTTQTATVEKDNIKVEVPIGKQYILINGQKKTTDTVALIKDNRTYLPIRPVLEAFGANVGWEQSTQTVTVSKNSTSSVQEAKIHFIDVGQADSILIDIGEYEILIDGGNNDDGNLVCNYIKPFIDGNIEIVIGTHVHEDHIGGLDTVLNNYKVDTVIDSGQKHTTKTYEDYITAIKNNGAKALLDADMTFNIADNIKFDIIELTDNDSNTNNNSVTALLTVGNKKALFAGDIESDIETTYINKFSKVDIYKVSHHGSKTSSCLTFLNKIKPQISVISYGVGNSYNHPNKVTIQNLLNIGSEVYGTGKSGTIISTIKDDKIIMNIKEQLTVNDAGDLADTSKVENQTSSSQESTDCLYVGSSNSNKYHYPSCRYAKKISEENLVKFKSVSEATSKGYQPCGVCNPK